MGSNQAKLPNSEQNALSEVSTSSIGVQTELRCVPCKELCNEEWKKYLDNDYKLQDGWEIILEDNREFDTRYTVSTFFAATATIFENLLMGCKDLISQHVHSTFANVLTARLQSMLNIDYLHHKKREYNGIVNLTRMNNDKRRKCKHQMICVMSFRITSPCIRKGTQEELHNLESDVEMFVRIQLRSTKENFLPNSEDGDEDHREVCCPEGVTIDTHHTL